MEIKQQIAELKAQNEDNAKRIAELEKQLEKKPVVPWVGALVKNSMTASKFYWNEKDILHEQITILDSPLHPQFMPNDGVNPWPDDMFVQCIHKDGFTYAGLAVNHKWNKTDVVLGSRPACGWAEYLKERDNGTL